MFGSWRWRVLGPCVLFLAAYFSIDVLLLAMSSWFGMEGLVWNSQLAGDSRSNFKYAVMLCGCVFYGATRMTLRHPAVNRSYLQWLRTTPWIKGMSLPLGQIHLDWRDAVLLTMLVLLGWFNPMGRAGAPTYLVCRTLSGRWDSVVFCYGISLCRSSNNVVCFWGSSPSV
jgi:hypothetical protein